MPWTRWMHIALPFTVMFASCCSAVPMKVAMIVPPAKESLIMRKLGLPCQNHELLRSLENLLYSNPWGSRHPRVRLHITSCSTNTPIFFPRIVHMVPKHRFHHPTRSTVSSNTNGNLKEATRSTGLSLYTNKISRGDETPALGGLNAK